MKSKKISFIVVVCLLVSFMFLRYIPKKVTSPTTVLSANSTIGTFTVEQKIIYGNTTPEESKTQEVIEGDTVLDLLIKTKNPEIKEYSFGKAVESIDGIKNGMDKKYWIYSVNGKEANVGAGDYKLTQGDKIVWEHK